MEPKLIEIQPFTVSGISVRTLNSDEAQPSKAKLPGLWGQFFGQGLADKVPNKLAESPVYGVYSAYESDASGQYSVTAGVSVSKASPAFDSIEVSGGPYLVFETKGPMPQIVIENWARVWSFFETSKEFKRSFTIDFEVYRGPDEVAIHIAVEVDIGT
ncbi:MAG: GyrI-like domain-containing protein [Acidobacteriota bacterium]|nr:GyrI-like domain-containing protein [Acidobacteriota bacterium]